MTDVFAAITKGRIRKVGGQLIPGNVGTPVMQPLLVGWPSRAANWQDRPQTSTSRDPNGTHQDPSTQNTIMAGGQCPSCAKQNALTLNNQNKPSCRYCGWNPDASEAGYQGINPGSQGQIQGQGHMASGAPPAAMFGGAVTKTNAHHAPTGAFGTGSSSPNHGDDMSIEQLRTHMATHHMTLQPNFVPATVARAQHNAIHGTNKAMAGDLKNNSMTCPKCGYENALDRKSVV